MNDIEVTQDPNNALMAQVLASGNIEVLERYIALKEREEKRQASKDFDKHFSEMQAEFPVVHKRQAAKDYSGNEMYKYAPLEVLQMAFQPVIAKHGFAYTFSEEAIEGGKRITMRISGHGSERFNHYEVPTLDSNKRTNKAQAGGGTSSYGQRYAFKAGFGLIIAGEDDDAQTERDPVALIAPTQTLKDCKDAEALKSAWAAIYTKHRGDSYEIKQLTAVYTEMKGKLA